MAQRDVKNVIGEWYKENVKPQIQALKSQRFFREIAVVLVIVVVTIFAVWGYRAYRLRKEAAEQIALAQGIQACHEAETGETIQWEQAELLLQNGYEQHKHGKLAPFFLVFMADAQVKQNKLAEAVATMKEAIEALPSDSPFIDLYKIKYVLMRKDLPDEVDQDAGLADLRTLAYAQENHNRDCALYYLGLHYWLLNDLAQAKTIWQELTELVTTYEKGFGVSPWGKLAQAKLALCGCDELKEG